MSTRLPGSQGAPHRQSTHAHTHGCDACPTLESSQHSTRAVHGPADPFPTCMQHHSRPDQPHGMRRAAAACPPTTTACLTTTCMCSMPACLLACLLAGCLLCKHLQSEGRCSRQLCSMGVCVVSRVLFLLLGSHLPRFACAQTVQLPLSVAV